MCEEKIVRELVDRVLADDQQREAETFKAIADMINRNTNNGGYQDTVNRLAGNAGGMEPLATATARDQVLLFVPASASNGTWEGFERAKQEAVTWLCSHRFRVVDGHLLGQAFQLDPEPLTYRDAAGNWWYNAAVDNETDFYRAVAQGVVNKLDSQK
ncbi:hypothetical protein [uncultured Flavonifractor sp.]|uniref:hypothetical protein n=1 Tax=uncultured Flavonifractor sp. TaxID=1193534 RepID=UPI002602CF7C|nr:hypothetical protein [uncultured Flavonifractor sp.]